MNRNEVLWFDKRGDKFQFLFAAVSAHMHRGLAAIGVVDLCAPPIEVVHHPADGPFVSRNMAGRKNHSVALFNFEIFVIIQREPGKRRHRLALTTASYDTDFLPRVTSDFL